MRFFWPQALHVLITGICSLLLIGFILHASVALLPLLRSTGMCVMQKRLAESCSMNLAQLVESHQPGPEHQQLSSASSFRCSVLTLVQLLFRNASARFGSVASFLAPMQGTNCACKRKRAVKLPSSCFVTSSIAPTPTSGVIGKSSRPMGRKASSQTANGSVAPALT